MTESRFARPQSPRCRARAVGALLCGALVLGSVRPGAAAPGVSLGVYGLYGNTWSSGTPLNPHGPGLGAQAGVTLPGSLYLGGSLQQFFGLEVNETLLSDPPILIDRSAWQSRLLAHVGYSWDLVAVTLRPSLGVGYSLLTRQTTSSGAGGSRETSSTEHGLVLSPGVEARFPLGALSLCAQLGHDTVLLDGADANALLVGVGLGIDL